MPSNRKPRADATEDEELKRLPERSRDLIEVMRKAGLVIRTVVGPDEADGLLRPIVDAVSRRNTARERLDWEKSIEVWLRHGVDPYRSSPIARLIKELEVYGRDGTPPKSINKPTPNGAIEEGIRKVREFLAAVPEDWGLAPERRILAIAAGRYAVTRRRPIGVEALAALGGVSPQHIRNFMVRTKNRLARHTEQKDKITADSAKEWLKKKGIFVRQD